ncbi:MAG TPA: hypothetical protein VFV80_00160 [Geminicoccaceae bacterium]|nr:hypothetical protein [Geminicoccaceae bacterium]
MRRFHASEHERLFLLLTAFAVVLLASISTTMATTASELALIDGLRRDLGAVRAQLERVDAAPAGAGERSVAFNADLGDGGSAFRQRSMATILRSARRRLESLAAGYRSAGDAQRAELAQNAQLELHELSGHVHALGDTGDVPSSTWTRNREKAETLIDRLEAALARLLARSAAERSSDLG